MKCPKCGKNRVKYNVPRSDTTSGSVRKPIKRTDFHCKCLDCKWEGEL